MQEFQKLSFSCLPAFRIFLLLHLAKVLPFDEFFDPFAHDFSDDEPTFPQRDSLLGSPPDKRPQSGTRCHQQPGIVLKILRMSLNRFGKPFPRLAELSQSDSSSSAES